MTSEVMVRERKSVKYGKTYEYRFEIASIGSERKWMSKGGFLSAKEARKAGTEALKEYALCGAAEKTAQISFSDFLDEWMQNDCRYSLKETTISNYRKRIENHIKPELGMYQLDKLKRTRLQKFIQKKYDEGYSKNTLSVLRGILSKSLRYAVGQELISSSPAEYLKIPRSEVTAVPTRSSPHSYLSADKMKKIFERFPEESTSYIPIMLGYHCGLRICEVYALTWDDIDLKNGRLTVSKQVQWKQNARSKEKKKEANGTKCSDAGFWYFSTPKYESYRTIEMDKQMTELLSREYQRQGRARKYFDNRYKRYYEDANRRITEEMIGHEVLLLCRRENGEYIHPRTMQYTSRVIHEELRIPEFDFHSLRHTHATMLIEEGAPLKYVQQRLGHKKIEVTMNIYQHGTDTIREQGNTVIENMFKKVI